MGLLRGVARTAAIAGTATAVSNRVSRRQGNRWAQQDAEAAPPPPPAPAPAAPAVPAAPSAAEQLTLLKQLGELHADGTLTDEEFAAQKAKIIG